MFYPRQLKLGRIAPVPMTLRFFAGDMPDWSVVLHGEGRETAVKVPQVADLYLALWRRAELPDPDPDVAAVLAAPITP
jgi:non-ribosomal peptide synthetase component F